MNSSKAYDVVVIGGGVGGYTTAIRLVQHGLKVALIEKRLIGGECTNYGCVPTKALYTIAKSVKQLKLVGTEGIFISNPFAFARRMAGRAREGIEFLLQRYGVDVYFGEAKVKDGVVKVFKGRESHELAYRYLVVATGTEPRSLPGIDIDENGILSNRGFTELNDIPSRLLIVGGGVIGIELASIMSILGSQVTVVEVLSDILYGFDKDIIRIVKMYLREQGVKILTSTTASKVEKHGDELEVHLSNGDVLKVDKVLLAVGRIPQARGLGLEELGVTINEKGYIVVDEYQRTSNPKILAVGDVTGPPLLAHKAVIEGKIAAHTILGKEIIPLKRDFIPIALFSIPEVGMVGLTEEQAKARGYKVKSIKIPVGVSSRSHIEGAEKGLLKVVMDERGNVLGLHAIGPNASELASIGLELIEKKLTFEDIAERPYAHLTALEILRELAEVIVGEPVHVYLKK